MRNAQSRDWLYLPFSWGPHLSSLPCSAHTPSHCSRGGKGTFMGRCCLQELTALALRSDRGGLGSRLHQLTNCPEQHVSPLCPQCPHLQNRVMARSGELLRCAECWAWWHYLTAIITSTILQCYACFVVHSQEPISWLLGPRNVLKS